MRLPRLVVRARACERARARFEGHLCEGIQLSQSQEICGQAHSPQTLSKSSFARIFLIPEGQWGAPLGGEWAAYCTFVGQSYCPCVDKQGSHDLPPNSRTSSALLGMKV